MTTMHTALGCQLVCPCKPMQHGWAKQAFLQLAIAVAESEHTVTLVKIVSAVCSQLNNAAFPADIPPELDACTNCFSNMRCNAMHN